MNKLRILVFPCGSEVGLEIYRSLKYSRHVELYGASSVDDHGKFVYENYIGGLPMLNENNFLDELKKIISENKIDAIYPAMDKVISTLKPLENELNCKIIASPVETSRICASKKETYKSLNKIVKTPVVYEKIESITNFPVFIKPDVGYGSRGAKVVYDKKEAINHLNEWDNCIITEYLPGEEYTVDCFTNRNGELLFAGPRPRRRIRTGISVNTVSIPRNNRSEFEEIAKKINKKLKFRGAWFFQVKRNTNNELVLMEAASRMGGSSLLYRYKGVNFALLSIFDAFDCDVEIIENEIDIEIDRALDVVVKLNFKFKNVYIDFDDCLIIDGKVNYDLVGKLFQWINEGKRVYLLTRHEGDIEKSLNKYRLINIFDEVIHLNKFDKKSKFITNKESIFIDDSYAERKDVAIITGIPVFSPDMIN